MSREPVRPSIIAVSARKIIDSSQIANTLESMAGKLATQHRETASLIVVGIANGGILVAERLAALLGQKLGRPIPTGVLSVAFQRDDIGLNPIPNETEPTHLPGDVDGATVLLVDDVIFGGRTIRAAIEELFSLGRPSRVQLAVLVDRGNRRLPFAADVTGFVEPTEPAEKVIVTLDPDDPRKDSIHILASA
ncbi:MAG: bifunctional pyr operon transcriptional regulator/uracil phosphoribosyltransferase PyrR [Opitutaceae bacterium]